MTSEQITALQVIAGVQAAVVGLMAVQAWLDALASAKRLRQAGRAR